MVEKKMVIYFFCVFFEVEDEKGNKHVEITR